MKRKLVRQGKTALTITLPSTWTKKYSLNSGDEIEIEETGKNLTVSTSKLTETKERIEVDAAKTEPYFFLYIMALYRKGYDEIKINFKNPSLIKEIHSVRDSLMGFEIVNEEMNSCTLKEITKPSEEQFDSILKRLFLVIISIAEDSLVAINSNDKATLNNIRYRDEKTVNRFTNFCLRILTKKGYKEFEKTPLLYSFIRDLEKISDEYKYLSLHRAKATGSIDKKLIEIYEGINTLLKDNYDLFYNFNDDLLRKVAIKKKELIFKLKKIKMGDIKAINNLGTILSLIMSLIETQTALYS